MIKQALHIRNFNDDFLLINATDSKVSLTNIGQQIYAQQFDFVTEVIVTEKEIGIKLNALFDAEKLELLYQFNTVEHQEHKSYRLPVYFSENDDWTEVLARTGLTKNVFITRLCDTEFSLAMFGFLPGFLYLDGLASDLQVARKKVPSKYIQANSLAIGGKYLGLYAVDSPGGWHVIGHTPLTILQKKTLPPLSLNLGDKIKCSPISKTEFDELLEQQINIISYNA